MKRSGGKGGKKMWRGDLEGEKGNREGDEGVSKGLVRAVDQGGGRE